MWVPSQPPFSFSFARILQLSFPLVFETPFTPCLSLQCTGAHTPDSSRALETACGFWKHFRWHVVRTVWAAAVLSFPSPTPLVLAVDGGKSVNLVGANLTVLFWPSIFPFSSKYGTSPHTGGWNRHLSFGVTQTREQTLLCHLIAVGL